MTTGVDAVTAAVPTENDAVDDPPGTVTLAGTVAAPVLPLASEITSPPLGADPVSVTVPLAVWPPVTVAGDTPTAASAGGVVVEGFHPSWITSKSLAVSAPNAGFRMSLSHRVSNIPVMYMSVPLSATIRP